MSAMSDTAWKISHTHQRVGEKCTCGGFRSALARDHSHHIAAVTEAAVRERVARDIEAAHTDASSWVAERHLAAWQAALAAAAKIARGGAA